MQIKTYNFWLTLIIGLFLNKWSDVIAQNSVIKNYSVNQGLPSSECYWVTQDSKGFLWVATDAGVVKYDGYKFITYNSTKGLPDNTVFKIHEDTHHRIWFSTYSGMFAYYLHETDSVYTIPANKQLSEITKMLPIDFCFGDMDTLWISIQLNGYLKVDPPLYKNVTHIRLTKDGLYIKEINKNNFIYGCDKLDYTSYHVFDLSFIGYKNSKQIPPFKNIKTGVNFLTALKLGDSNYFFGNGISLYGVLNKRINKLMDYHKMDNGYFITVFKDSKNNMWFGTTKQGALKFDGCKFDKQPKKFMDGNSVSCVFEDSDNGFWFTTTNNGINYIPSLKYSYFNSSCGLNADKVYAIAVVDSNMYCAVNRYKPNILNLNTQKITGTIKFQTTNLYSYDKSLVIVSHNGSYIYNTITEDLNTIKDSAGQKILIRKPADFDKENIIVCDQYSKIWITNKKTGTSVFLTLVPARIFSMYYFNGSLYIGTKKGLYKFEKSKLTFFGDSIPLLNNRVVEMIEQDKTLFIATKGFGVLCFKNNKIIAIYNEANGLASDVCKCIAKDTYGNIWIGTNRGISRLKKDIRGQYKCTSLNLFNGLISNEINQIIAYNKQLYFATNSGLGTFDISDAFDKQKSIPVYIEYFFVKNIKTPVTAKHVLNYDENFIKINYKGIYLKNEGNINYKYRLEGLDTNWTHTKNTFVQFTTLPAGNYKFVVYAIDDNAFLSLKPAVISFSIKQPFWKTVWFITLIFITVCMVLYIIYKIHINGIKRQEKEKAAFNKLLVESELKGLRAQMNPHFIFNAMNSIQNFIIKNESVIAQKYLTKFSRLIRSVLENSKQEVILLSIEIKTLKLYLELEALRASFSFDFRIDIDEKLQSKTIYIPNMLIQPYVENAILHGILPLKNLRGSVIVSFEEENDYLVCTVNDNGIGRANAMKIKQKKNLHHHSMGMSVTK